MDGMSLPGARAYPCPKCNLGPFEANFDVTDWETSGDIQILTVTVRADGTVVADMDPVPDHGSDSFLYARCLSCGLALVNEPGETRLRRAIAKQNEPGAYTGLMARNAYLTREQEASLYDLAYWLSDTAVAVGVTAA